MLRRRHSRLTIVVSRDEVGEIEERAEQCRARVRKLFEQYRPAALGGGNGEQANVCLFAGARVLPVAAS
jgi:hypothetical protein